MTGAVALSTPAESSQFDRFREAEAASLAAKPLGLDEMIDRLLAESHSLELSAHVAETVYGAPFHSEVLRRCAALSKAAAWYRDHAADVIAIQRGSTAAPKRRRA